MRLQQQWYVSESVLSNLRISSNLESDTSIRNRIFRIFDSNRCFGIRRFESEYEFEGSNPNMGSKFEIRFGFGLNVRDSIAMFSTNEKFA